MVASTKSLFQGLEAEVAPGEELLRIDRSLRGVRLRRMAMSLCLARWREGELTVAVAGMPPVLVYRGTSARVE